METSRFFGGPAGAIPEYNQTHDAEVYRLMFSYGVFDNVENKLAVTETDPLSLGVKVDTGWAFVHGFWYHNDSALTKSLGAADPVNPRIDRIILRLDTVTNFKISCEVLEGTPAAEPTAPSLTQSGGIYEISLAQVLVGAGVTSVSNANITDERDFVATKPLAGVVKTTGDQTIAGKKTFTDTLETDAIAEKTAAHGVTIDGINLKDDLDTSGIVAKTGAQTIAGVKSFNSGAIIHTPQTYTPAASGTATLDLSKGNRHRIQMPAGNITIAISNATIHQIFEVAITQDGTGSRTVTWFNGISWADGSAPTLTTTASKRDVFIFIVTGANTYDGFIAGQNI
jgi:hypothetical protein